MNFSTIIFLLLLSLICILLGEKLMVIQLYLYRNVTDHHVAAALGSIENTLPLIS